MSTRSMRSEKEARISWVKIGEPCQDLFCKGMLLRVRTVDKDVTCLPLMNYWGARDLGSQSTESLAPQSVAAEPVCLYIWLFNCSHI